MSSDVFADDLLIFFFKQKTAYEMRISDWSSDVCSSDLDRFGPWQAEETTGLVERIAQTVMATGDRDDVEQVAMFAGGGVGPFTRRAASVLRSCKTDIEAAPRRVAGVADQPITALAMPLRQVVTAHRLGLDRKSTRLN